MALLPSSRGGAAPPLGLPLPPALGRALPPALPLALLLAAERAADGGSAALALLLPPLGALGEPPGAPAVEGLAPGEKVALEEGHSVVLLQGAGLGAPPLLEALAGEGVVGVKAGLAPSEGDGVALLG